MSGVKGITYRIRTVAWTNQEWSDRAACIGQDLNLFFPASDNKDTRQSHVQTRAAKQICLRCPVRDECLGTFIAEPFGVFGGTTAKERESMRRRMRRGVESPAITGNSTFASSDQTDRIRGRSATPDRCGSEVAEPLSRRGPSGL